MSDPCCSRNQNPPLCPAFLLLSTILHAHPLMFAGPDVTAGSGLLFLFLEPNLLHRFQFDATKCSSSLCPPCLTLFEEVLSIRSQLRHCLSLFLLGLPFLLLVFRITLLVFLLPYHVALRKFFLKLGSAIY
jgi:hypothetical protein